ncbi:MAG: radical SAM protein [Spirochaetia bacterium]|jgi:putative pyruvate formate lyase activating enzyme
MQNETCYPAYLHTSLAGQLLQKADKLEALSSPCRLCPNMCGAHRKEGECGKCRLGIKTFVASASPHFGEEAPLVGNGGSGAIFFASCNMACVFCQNYEISHFPGGDELNADQLAGVMLRLQRLGCHNINLVTPTHVVHAIVRALAIAAQKGLRIPLVYNCGGYEALETLRLLEGVIDIYMPDIKYSSNEEALRYSNVRDYWERAKESVREMYRQVGDLEIDGNGVARRGLLIRHLVMPGNLAGTDQVLEFIAREISRDSYVNLMDQYRPCFKASRIPELSRPATRSEYLQCITDARRAGLTRGLSNWP